MLAFPHINPVALELGPLKIHWYGLMYLIAFALVWILGRYRIKKGIINLTKTQLEDLIFYGAMGVILGGRLGYVFFYQPAYYFSNPSNIIAVWDGGMSFHGGLIGVITAMFIFALKVKRPFFEIADTIAPLVPLGLAFGRLGNFINGELWGRVTDVSWAMVFPYAGDLPRHPSQLYEMGTEGILLFIIVWWFSSKPRPIGQTSAVFLMGYGLFRFLVEYTREPDSYLGTLAFGFSMGQWLSIPMILAGIILYIFTLKKPRPQPKA